MAQSLDQRAIPFGLGFHPYLTAGTETVDGAILHVPACQTLDVDDRGLPTGAVTPVEGTERDFRSSRFVGPAVLDTAYTDLVRDADGRARAVDRRARRSRAAPSCGSTRPSGISWCTRATRWARCTVGDGPWRSSP